MVWGEGERDMIQVWRGTRGLVLLGWLGVGVACMPYYSSQTYPGPESVDVFFIGKVKGPPERTYFHIGLPWSPWLSYHRVLIVDGPLNVQFSQGYNATPFCWSTLPLLGGASCLYFAWRRRRRAKMVEQPREAQT